MYASSASNRICSHLQGNVLIANSDATVLLWQWFTFKSLEVQDYESDLAAAIEASVAEALRNMPDTAPCVLIVTAGDPNSLRAPLSDDVARIYIRQGSQWVEYAGELTPVMRAIAGLRNRPTENNCFLNVVVQVFSDIPELRNTILHLPSELQGNYHDEPIHPPFA